MCGDRAVRLAATRPKRPEAPTRQGGVPEAETKSKKPDGRASLNVEILTRRGGRYTEERARIGAKNEVPAAKKLNSMLAWKRGYIEPFERLLGFSRFC